MTIKVVGVHYRKRNAFAFTKAVRKAERRGSEYGVRLKREPNNSHDSNAVAVFGVVVRRGWVRRILREWHIGYLPRELAAELHRDLISPRATPHLRPHRKEATGRGRTHRPSAPPPMHAAAPPRPAGAHRLVCAAASGHSCDS
ncbi:MAG: HIRAN domain-containing protein [Alphaproteobacteria bacterium]